MCKVNRRKMESFQERVDSTGKKFGSSETPFVFAKTALALSASDEGRDELLKIPNILVLLVNWIKNAPSTAARDSCSVLVNISGDERGAQRCLNLHKEAPEAVNKLGDNIVNILLSTALEPKSPLADSALMVLCNLTRLPHFAEQTLSLLINDENSEEPDRLESVMDKILNSLTNPKYNTVGENLHHLGHLVCNLTQLETVRRYMLDHKRGAIQRLLPFTEYQDSVIRRSGVVGAIRNCCFDLNEHAWLLGPEVDILPRLLLPLAGPEEFDDEDNNKLPIEVQWLPEDKLREVDSDVRKMLLESLTQLCAKKVHREQIRDKNVYVILREFHKWETDRQSLLACENLVDILIRREDEIGEDNLRDLEVPSDLTEKFVKMDKDFLEES